MEGSIFKWIFSIVAGGLIFVFLMRFAVQEVDLSGKLDTRVILNNLDESQKKQILQQAESRLDKNLDFFIRFDKDSWMNEKKLVLTDSGKCFHIKMSMAAFPKKMEIAAALVRKLLSDF